MKALSFKPVLGLLFSLLVLGGLFLISCAGTDTASTPVADSDGDGLGDQAELATHGTSPYLSDTDGDGLDDFEEVRDFDPKNNRYRSNPIIADVPCIDIRIISVPKVTINLKRSGQTDRSVSNESTEEIDKSVSVTDTSESTHAIEKTHSVSVEASYEFGTGPGVSAGYGFEHNTRNENTFSWSKEQSEAKRNALARAETLQTSEGWAADNATLTVAVRVENRGYRAFTLTNLALSAAWPDPDEPGTFLLPVGNLQWAGFGDFPPTSFAPGEREDLGSFATTLESVDLAKSILRNPKGLSVKVSSYQAVDKEGNAFDFRYDTIGLRTASVIIDYCGESGKAAEHFMIATKADPDNQIVTAQKVMHDFLAIPYETANGVLTGIRDVDADAGKNGIWLAVKIYYDDAKAETLVETYDPGKAVYDFDEIELKAGDVLQLVYIKDEDGDGLYAREEFLNGSSDTNDDTDNDGLLDVEEIKGELTGGTKIACTGPGVFDTDFDGLGDGVDPAPLDVNSFLISAGDYFTLAMKTDGTLIAWGLDDHGQLGDGKKINQTNPIPVSTGNVKWAQIACGSNHTVAVASNYSLYAWGYNNKGQLGNGSTAESLSPIPISIANWKQVSTGLEHTLAIDVDGSLWAWGDNTYGQLGDGNHGSGVVSLTPIEIDAGPWVQVSAGHSHSVAVKADGSVWAWGKNTDGQLGDGTTTDSDEPVPIQESGPWACVSAGSNHTAAIKADGTLWTWGSNSNGQLGNGQPGNKSSPLQINTDPPNADKDWKQVAAGHFHTLALKTDGSLWGWGRNVSGELGTDTVTESWVPIRVGTGTAIWEQERGWVQVSAGGNHSAAVRSDGQIFAWGYNLYGQVGNGTIVDVDEPVLVENVLSGDIWPPKVISMSPASGATMVAYNISVTATFNEAVQSSTVNAGTFKLKAGTTEVAGTVSCSDTTVIFKPSAALAQNTVYTATISGVKDLAGNTMTADKTWSFTTLEKAPPAAPTNLKAEWIYRIMDPDTNEWLYVYGASWTDNADTEAGFTLERTTTTTSGVPISGWSVIATLGASSGTGLKVKCPDTLTPGTTYQYRVRAFIDAATYSAYAYSNIYTHNP